MIGLFIFVVYAISARYVLKRLPSRRAKAIVWAIIVLTWGPALFVAFAPPSSSQPGDEAAYVGKFVEVLLAVGLPLMPLAAVGFGIARAAAAPQSKNIIAGVTVFLGFFMLFGDEIAGRIYLSHLCVKEAGVKVYHTVELPAKYWDEQGKARFYVNFDSLLGKSYSVKYKSGPYSSIFYIDNAGYAYSNTLTGQVLGEAIDFRYWGGWINRNLFPPSAKSCIDYSDPSNRLIDRIFIPEHQKSK
jgi:hypothetical protein